MRHTSRGENKHAQFITAGLLNVAENKLQTKHCSSWKSVAMVLRYSFLSFGLHLSSVILSFKNFKTSNITTIQLMDLPSTSGKKKGVLSTYPTHHSKSSNF
jgi:hypothetical protein